MSSSSPAMDRLVASLKRLPGIGEKSATRLAYFLLSAPPELSRELSEAIARLQRDTVVCETCFTLSDRTPCPVCAHPDATGLTDRRGVAGRGHLDDGCGQPVQPEPFGEPTVEHRRCPVDLHECIHAGLTACGERRETRPQQVEFHG